MDTHQNEQDLHGTECFGFITHYMEGTKIDYCVYPVEFLRWVSRQARLTDDLDNGFRVLLDKDCLTAALPAPTYTAHLPVPPTADEYLALIEEFFNDAACVAKNQWRDHLRPDKLSLDHIMKFLCLRKMLEWRIGIEHHWSLRPGAVGKDLRKHIDHRRWAALERTYVGAGTAENWAALFDTIDLFRLVSIEVAEGLGYEYPHVLDERVVVYLHKVKGLNHDAVTLG